MTVQEYLAKRTLGIAEGFVHFLKLTPEDRRDWRLEATDGSHTRSMLEQAGECVSVNRMFAKMLKGESFAPGEDPMAEAKFENIEEAEKLLLESAAVLASAIRELPDASLEKTFVHPKGFQILGENLILLGFRNMAYHVGQVNFIQTLYGDHVFQAPSNWR